MGQPIRRDLATVLSDYAECSNGYSLFANIPDGARRVTIAINVLQFFGRNRTVFENVVDNRFCAFSRNPFEFFKEFLGIPTFPFLSHRSTTTAFFGLVYVNGTATTRRDSAKGKAIRRFPPAVPAASLARNTRQKSRNVSGGNSRGSVRHKFFRQSCHRRK